MPEPSEDEPSTSDDFSTAVEPSVSKSPMPFDGLTAPVPAIATPPAPARWLAFAGVLVGGLLGGLIGYGIGDILSDSATVAALGALLGGLICAVGVGIVASLTLRAMNEWKVSIHPEDPRNHNKA